MSYIGGGLKRNRNGLYTLLEKHDGRGGATHMLVGSACTNFFFLSIYTYVANHTSSTMPIEVFNITNTHLASSPRPN